MSHLPRFPLLVFWIDSKKHSDPADQGNSTPVVVKMSMEHESAASDLDVSVQEALTGMEVRQISNTVETISNLSFHTTW